MIIKYDLIKLEFEIFDERILMQMAEGRHWPWQLQLPLLLARLMWFFVNQS